MLNERKVRFKAAGSYMSDVDELSASAIAPRVGADLRAARERLGWSLQDVASLLRIRGQYLVALEAGRIDELPGTTYALGFLRTYAEALGLDPEELGRRFRAEVGEINRKTELSFPAPVPERGVPAGALVLLGVVLVIGAYVGWYRLSGEGALPPEVPPPVPARLAPLAEQAVPPSPVTPKTQSLSQPQAVATPGPAQGATASTTPDAGTSHAAPAVASASSPPAQPAASPASEPAAVVSPTQAAAATTTPPQGVATIPAAEQSRIVLSASADAWLYVRDKSGQVLLNRVLHPGESWVVPPLPNLLLTTGNAGGTEIMVDGSPTPSLGGSGSVRRDIPLDPDLLKAGKLGAVTAPITTASAGTGGGASSSATVAPRAASQ